MKKTFNDLKDRFKRYFGETYKNKLIAVSMFTIGGVAAIISKGDCTVLVLMLLLGVPLLFVKENWIK